MRTRRSSDVLRAHAPMWLLQMPSLITPSDRESFGREMLGGTRERMLREMSDGAGGADRGGAARARPRRPSLERLLDARPDFVPGAAAADRSTHGDRDLPPGGVDRQRSPAEGGEAGAPGQASLRGTGARVPAPRGPSRSTSPSGFPPNRFPAEVAALIHERTEGNPLFMVNTIDYLVTERLIEQHEAAGR